MIDDYAVGSNGGSLAIKYWSIIPFPNFDKDIEMAITYKYHNPNAIFAPHTETVDSFLNYDNNFNKIAGICEIDKSMNYLKDLLDSVIQNIADDKEVIVRF